MNYRNAKVFRNGGSQAVRLPAAFQFQCSDVWVFRRPGTDDVVLSPRPPDWTLFLDELRLLPPDPQFMTALEPSVPSPAPHPEHGACG